MAGAEVKARFDGALFLRLSRRTVRLSEHVLRFHLRHVPLVAWDFVDHALVVGLLAEGHGLDTLCLFGLTQLG